MDYLCYLMLKRTFAQILILLLVLPIGLTTGYLKWQQRIIKRDVKSTLFNSLDDKDLTRLSFHTTTVSNLNWKDSYEFSHQGEMYDVVKVDTLKDSVVFWCWHDIKESKIEKQISALFKASFYSKPDSQRASQQLWNYLLTLYHEFSVYEVSKSVAFYQNSKIDSDDLLTNTYLSIPSPPPRIC